MKKLLSLALIVASPILLSQTAIAKTDYFKTDGSFKRFSVSGGWLHAAPQGDPKPMQNTTAAKDGMVAENGSVKASTVADILVKDQEGYETIKPVLESLGDSDLGELGMSGSSRINGLESFASAPGSGLKSDTTDTVGLLFNYYVNDNWSVELKAGLPPKVDILGKGEVFAPLTGTAITPVGEYAIEKIFQSLI